MSEMVERVARAVYEADDPWSDAFPWPDLNESQNSPETYRRIARAAIEAMRRPTDEVAVALDRVPGGWGRGAWIEGIDAALREKQDG